jgi:hypothetical protein
MNRFTLTLGALCAATLSGPSAFAEEACAPRAEIVAKLAQDFRERQEAVGLVNDQAVLEVFVSANGTWTILASGTDGTSCVLSAGQDWEGASFVKGLDTRFHRPAAASPADDRRDPGHE